MLKSHDVPQEAEWLRAAQRFEVVAAEGVIQGYRCVSSGCSSIIFKIRQDKRMCTLLKERREGEILIYGLLQFPPSFIMLSLCTPPSFPSRELLFLSVQPASHSHVWVTSCVLHSDPEQNPSIFFPSLSPQLHCHTLTPKDAPWQDYFQRTSLGNMAEGDMSGAIPSVIVHQTPF